jgi:hypothetical protein
MMTEGKAMEIRVLTRSYKQATLSTEHSACSYGQAVLLIDGQPHGVADLVSGELPTVVIETTARSRTMEEMTARLDVVNRWNEAVIHHADRVAS